MEARDPTFERWRAAFYAAVEDPDAAAPLKEASLAANLRSWTRELTTVVVRSCASLGWHAAAKGHQSERLPQPGQEYLGIDVLAFPGAPSVRWPLPVAAFELENHASDDRVAYSLWKVLCLRTELRMVFAFRPDHERGRRMVHAVGADVIGGLRPDQRAALAGQTALVVGNRGEGETFPWGFFTFWLLDANVGRFEKV